ncbi:MAG: hypothetical protein ABSB13_02150 [Candidatus Binatus sp.]|jgi:hypothetical protein|uniref:hypothetical protein n=1 Tax=Candidatus Binatus sp. TaxID=2811406 RepID=UPI003D0AD6D4
MKNKQSITDRLIAVLDGLTIDEATGELKSAINALQVSQVVRSQVCNVGPELKPTIKAPKSSVIERTAPIPGTT